MREEIMEWMRVNVQARATRPGEKQPLTRAGLRIGWSSEQYPSRRARLTVLSDRAESSRRWCARRVSDSPRDRRWNRRTESVPHFGEEHGGPQGAVEVQPPWLFFAGLARLLRNLKILFERDQIRNWILPSSETRFWGSNFPLIRGGFFCGRSWINLLDGRWNQGGLPLDVRHSPCQNDFQFRSRLSALYPNSQRLFLVVESRWAVSPESAQALAPFLLSLLRHRHQPSLSCGLSLKLSL